MHEIEKKKRHLPKKRNGSIVSAREDKVLFHCLPSAYWLRDGVNPGDVPLAVPTPETSGAAATTPVPITSPALGSLASLTNLCNLVGVPNAMGSLPAPAGLPVPSTLGTAALSSPQLPNPVIPPPHPNAPVSNGSLSGNIGVAVNGLGLSMLMPSSTTTNPLSTPLSPALSSPSRVSGETLVQPLPGPQAPAAAVAHATPVPLMATAPISNPSTSGGLPAQTPVLNQAPHLPPAASSLASPDVLAPPACGAASGPSPMALVE